MGDSPPITLVVGADGFVGSALAQHLRSIGESVIGTTRRRHQVTKCNVFLDLAEQQGSWQCPQQVDVAVICAGVTKLGACERAPEGSSRVNVLRTCELANNLVSQGAFVIYMSSSAVFDGSIPHRRPDDAVSPVTEYGRQKAQAETQLLQMGSLISVVRFTKILGPYSQPFAGWKHSLCAGDSIQPYMDMVLAPISVSFAASVLRQVADKRLSGIVHVSGDRDVSYAEAAKFGARYIGAEENLVQPVKSSKSRRFADPLPAHTTLNTDRLKSALAIEPPDISTAILGTFGKPEN